MTEVELHIHIRKDGKALINPERIQLLRLIGEKGSLLMASRHLGLSYNKAWKIMDGFNHASDQPVVEKLRGGKGGGGATLTGFGKLILMEYTAMEKIVSEFTQKMNTEINL